MTMSASGNGSADRSVVLASRNPHKLNEMQRLLEPAGITVEPLPDEVVLPHEDGTTFADNALPKALTAAAATGRAAIADDSGIEAAALSGGPGVRSAVAWTSTSPPSPVITTLASTSALESSR